RASHALSGVTIREEFGNRTDAKPGCWWVCTGDSMVALKTPFRSVTTRNIYRLGGAWHQMLRNYLITALRNIAHNKVYAIINAVGLSIALAAAILIALYVRHETTYDTNLPGYARVYSLTETITT